MAQAVSSGSTFFAYGVFVKPLAAEFDAPRLVVVLGLTALMFVQGIVSPMLGRALDVRSVRALMAVGSLACGLGFLGLSVATSLWQIAFLFSTLIAIGSHMFGPLATATLVANWFVRERGRALGVTAVGASFGGLVFPPVTTELMAAFGWRGAATAFAALLAALAVPLWLMVVNRPEDIGLAVDGEPPEVPEAVAPGLGVPEPASSAPQAPGPPPQAEAPQLLRSRNLWGITAAIALAFCPVSVLLAHLVPYATDRGIEPGPAALLMSGYAAASMVGRLLFGWLSDRMDKRLALWIVLGLLALAWSGIVIAPGYGGLMLACVGMGFGVGGIMPLWGALTGACFGRAWFGRAMGTMNPLMLPFNLAGAPVAAAVYDRTGSYTLVFTAFLGTFVAAALAGALIRIPKHEPGLET